MKPSNKHIMKTPFLLLLLSVVLSSFLHGEAAVSSSPVAVLDVDGKPVQVGVKYYVVPVKQSQGGGLDLSPTASQPCPRSVVQVGPKVQGNAIEFYPAVTTKDGVIRNGTDLNIEFPDAVKTVCSNYTKIWQITHDAEDTDTAHYVVSGGEKGNPSETTESNWFMILKTTNGYKFKFCPVSLCDCNPVCQDIGISVEGGKRLLEVDMSLPLFEVNFKKA